MFLHEEPVSPHLKTSIWQLFFNHDILLQDESLAITVKENEQELKEKAVKVFAENKVIHYSYIENIKFRDAMSMDYLKRIARLRAKSQLFSRPEIKHHDDHSGMNSEILFGKGE